MTVERAAAKVRGKRSSAWHLALRLLPAGGKFAGIHQGLRRAGICQPDQSEDGRSSMIGWINTAEQLRGREGTPAMPTKHLLRSDRGSLL
ncbi:MAG TPA: hypothetical protein VEK34_14890 [Methylocella sp.]|nr:hypothetical protein [Methylocella sp.]